MSDGEVARDTKKFSRNGAYWDYLTHSILDPLFFAAMGIAQYNRYGLTVFLFIAAFGAVAIGFYDSTKNNFYRALFSNGINRKDYEKNAPEEKAGSFFQRTHPALFTFFTFEGLLTFYVIIYFFDNIVLSKLVLIGYVLLFFLMSLVKIYLLSTRGTYPRRN